MSDPISDLGSIRRTRGMSQSDVARAMGVSQSRVSQIENSGELRMSTLENYADALGGHVSITAVFPDGQEWVLDPTAVEGEPRWLRHT